MSSTGERVRWAAVLVSAAAAFLPSAGASAQDEEEPAEEAEEEVPEPTGPITRVVHVVRSEDGTPISGAVVEAFGLPSGVTRRTAGDDGTVRFEDVPRKGVTLVARHPGRFCDWHEPGMWQWAQPEEERDPDGDGVTEFVLALARGTALEGQVVALADGKPIAGARVEAWEEDTVTCGPLELRIAPIWTVTTDGEGRFRTEEHFPTGRPSTIVARIVAAAPGWISETVEVPPTADGVYAPVTFGLRPAATLRGKVAGPDGKPVAGVAVHAYPSDFGWFHTGPEGTKRTREDEHPRVLEVTSDAEGRWTMAEATPGVKYFVFAELSVTPPGEEFGPETAVARSEIAAVASAETQGKATNCDLRLQSLSSLLVRVAAPDGTPVPGAHVVLAGPPRTRPWLDDEKLEDGKAFRELDPGKCTVTVSADGWLPHTSEIEVPAGTAVERTVRLDPGVAVEGIVSDDAGTPLEGVVVHVSPVDPEDADVEHEHSQSAPSGAGGRFRVTGLPAGPVEVSGGGEELIRSSVNARAPSDAVRLVVTRAARLAVRIDPPEGASDTTEVRVTVTDRAGRYEGIATVHRIPFREFPATFRGIRPGPLDVTVDVPGFAPTTSRVEVAPGAWSSVGPFALGPGVHLRGTVKDADGRPVAGAVVTPYENDARAVATDATGAFVLPHLAAGPLDLVVKAEGFPETIVACEARETGATLALVLRPGGLVRLRAKSAPGAHAERTRHCIFRASDVHGYGPHWHAESEDPATCEIRLPAGRYRWVESRYEFERRPVLFDVAEGAESVVELPLR